MTTRRWCGRWGCRRAPAFTPCGCPFPSALSFFRELVHTSDSVPMSAGRDIAKFESEAATWLTPMHTMSMVVAAATAAARGVAKAIKQYCFRRARVLTCWCNWECLGEDPCLAQCAAATPMRQLGHEPRPGASSEPGPPHRAAWVEIALLSAVQRCTAAQWWWLCVRARSLRWIIALTACIRWRSARVPAAATSHFLTQVSNFF